MGLVAAATGAGGLRRGGRDLLFFDLEYGREAGDGARGRVVVAAEAARRVRTLAHGHGRGADGSSGGGCCCVDVSMRVQQGGVGCVEMVLARCWARTWGGRRGLLVFARDGRERIGVGQHGVVLWRRVGVSLSVLLGKLHRCAGVDELVVGVLGKLLVVGKSRGSKPGSGGVRVH